MLHRSVHFLTDLVNGKWKVRVVKLQWLFILWLQTICKLSSLAIDIDEGIVHILCLALAWATNLLNLRMFLTRKCISTNYDIITNLILLVVLFLVTVQRKTFAIWVWKPSTKRSAHERERQVGNRCIFLVSCIAKIWRSFCPFVEGFLFQRSCKQANESGTARQGKTMFCFPAMDETLPPFWRVIVRHDRLVYFEMVFFELTVRYV